MRRILAFTLTCLLTVVSPATAMILGPGRYDGIVHFDRWGACYLHGGAYVMYVSDEIKQSLLPYSGKAVQIEVLELSQPMNPGDALITQCRVVGPATQTPGSRAAAAVRLSARPLFDAQPASFRLVMTNSGAAPLSLQASELSFTVLMKHDPRRSPEFPGPRAAPGTGSSVALITRAPINWRGLHDEHATPGSSGVRCKTEYSWRVPDPLPATVVLAPGESREVLVTLELPPGEYEMFAGYGGGVFAEQGYASSSVFFDVEATGVAREVQ